MVIFLLYLLVVVGIVLLSNKASEYVDLLDKKTSLSGAFIGGVMLSAVTSLPELFTSISSTIFLNEPGLCMGNILGSNLFNLATLATLVLVYFNQYKNATISGSHTKITLFTFLIYVVILLNLTRTLSFSLMTVSITSFIIIGLYTSGVKLMSAENGLQDLEDSEDTSPLTVRQISVRFALVSVGIIGLSIIITYLTNHIADTLNLGAGFAGALLLGIATSLPEVCSTLALFKMRNYNIAIGNIIGSNIFNFMILGLADIVYIGSGIYDFSDPKTISLLMLGMVATPLMLLLVKTKSQAAQKLYPIGIVACYFGFLVS